MKKILIGLSVVLMTLVSAQNYPDYYPNNNYGNSNYGDVDDEFYFPDDYYYEYPSDYYSNDLYQNYYNDYLKSIYEVNWNRFFAVHRLSPWQVQQIVNLNDSFPSYSAFNSYYRYNPDRWYYDRFYAMQRILGPNIFIVFQNNYYNGYNPVIYYQNYSRRQYARNIYVLPRYRNVNVNVYRVNKVQYHQSNPRQNIGFQPTRNGTVASANGTRNNEFRNDGVTANSNTRNNSIKNENQGLRNNEIRNDNSNARNNSVKSQSQIQTQNNNGFRNESGNREESIRNVAPTRKVESNSTPRSKQGTDSRTPSSSSRNSGQKFTAR